MLQVDTYSKCPLPQNGSDLAHRRDGRNRTLTKILCFISYERAGDIEVALQVEECRTIIALFEQGLKISANHIQSSEQSRSLTHRFKNLDGGEDAVFAISARERSVEITVNRSDDGDLAFCAGFEDAQRLIDALDEALRVESALRSK